MRADHQGHSLEPTHDGVEEASDRGDMRLIVHCNVQMYDLWICMVSSYLLTSSSPLPP
jgi:hypothetical protein